MVKFLRLPKIGDLYIHHIYLFYDEPLIFSVIDKEKQYYFVVSIPPSINDDETWLFVPISRGKLLKAEDNLLEIRDLLLSPEAEIYVIDQIENDDL